MSTVRSTPYCQAKNTQLIVVLNKVKHLLGQDNPQLEDAIWLLNKTINKIFNNKYGTPGNNQIMTVDEHNSICSLLSCLSEKYGRSKTNSGDPRVYALQARYWSRQGDVKSAIRLYHQIHKDYPAFFEAYELHIRLLESLGELNEASTIEKAFYKAKKSFFDGNFKKRSAAKAETPQGITLSQADKPFDKVVSPANFVPSIEFFSNAFPGEFSYFSKNIFYPNSFFTHNRPHQQDEKPPAEPIVINSFYKLFPSQ
jgi:hypothetical protein